MLFIRPSIHLSVTLVDRVETAGRRIKLSQAEGRYCDRRCRNAVDCLTNYIIHNFHAEI